jgi:putative IMPACT (imprinted ancient) family translation regulator
VRAYGDAVRAVLQVLPRAEKVPTHTVLLITPYSTFEQVRLAIEEHGGQILDEEFAVDVTVTARFAVERFGAFQVRLQELSNGTLEAMIIETSRATIMPLGAVDGGREIAS